MCKLNATLLNRQTQRINKKWSSRLRCDEELGLTTRRCTNVAYCKLLRRASEWDGLLGANKQRAGSLLAFFYE